jgi:hypothetical protein
MKNKNILLLLLVLTPNIPLHTADKTTGATAPSRLNRFYATAIAMLPAWLTTAPAPAPVVAGHTTPKAPIHSAPTAAPAPQPSSGAVAAPARSSAAAPAPAPIASNHKRKPAEATATAAAVIELLESDDEASNPAQLKRRNTSAPAAIIVVSDDEDDATSAAAAASDTATLKISKIPCLQQGDTNHCGFYATFFACTIAQHLATRPVGSPIDIKEVTDYVNNRVLFNSFIGRLFETLDVTADMGEYLSDAYRKDDISSSTCINDNGVQAIIHANGYSKHPTSCTNINNTDIINLYLLQDQGEPEKNRKTLHAKFEQMLTSLRTVQFNHEKPRAKNLKETIPYIHKTDVLNYRCMIMTANLHTICLFVDRTTSTMYYLDSLDNYFDSDPDFITALGYLLKRILE